MWSDGDSNNPRKVFVTQDTAFVAYFDTVNMYDVELLSSNDEMGYVTGAGRYCDGDTVEIRAYTRNRETIRFVKPKSVIRTESTQKSFCFVLFMP